MAFPQLIEEDFKRIDDALKDLLCKSEAGAVMLVEKAGHLIHQCGDQSEYPPDVMATLASNSFNAVQFMAGLLHEEQFPGMYQQGERFSTLMLNVDENCMLVIIFKADLSVGAVRFYAKETIQIIAAQLEIAKTRTPEKVFDLTDLNVSDVQALFRRKEDAPIDQSSENAESSSADADLAAIRAAEAVMAENSSAEQQDSAQSDVPAEMASPVIAKRGPFIEMVYPGEYHWCACGRSKTQPFCDGSHVGTGLVPWKVDITETKRGAFCGCKYSQNPPFCDGTHSKLPEE